MTRSYPQGVPCWIDVEHPDPGAAADFYTRLFGWTVESLPGGYAMAFLDGAEVAGFGTGDAGWSTYVAVDDADAAVVAVRDAGGTVTGEPDDAGPAGRGAACADPAGVPFRIWQADRRAGAQAANVSGAWNFSNLHAAEPVLDFYARVFGWRVHAVPGAGTMLQLPGYGAHLAATVDPQIMERQAGVPEGFADVIAGVAGADPDGVDRWHVVFTVADRDDAVATAQRLGATVEAQEETAWTRAARVRDPQGAVLTLSQFTPPDGF